MTDESDALGVLTKDLIAARPLFQRVFSLFKRPERHASFDDDHEHMWWIITRDLVLQGTDPPAAAKIADKTIAEWGKRWRTPVRLTAVPLTKEQITKLADEVKLQTEP